MSGTEVSALNGWRQHDPRYAGGQMPCKPGQWVLAAGHDREPNTHPVKASALYWGMGADTEKPIWWWKPVDPPENHERRLAIPLTREKLDKALLEILGRSELEAMKAGYMARPALLERACVSAFVNGADKETETILREAQWRLFRWGVFDFDEEGGAA